MKIDSIKIEMIENAGNAQDITSVVNSIDFYRGLLRGYISVSLVISANELEKENLVFDTDGIFEFRFSYFVNNIRFSSRWYVVGVENSSVIESEGMLFYHIYFTSRKFYSKNKKYKAFVNKNLSSVVNDISDNYIVSVIGEVEDFSYTFYQLNKTDFEFIKEIIDNFSDRYILLEHNNWHLIKLNPKIIREKIDSTKFSRLEVKANYFETFNLGVSNIKVFLGFDKETQAVWSANEESSGPYFAGKTSSFSDYFYCFLQNEDFAARNKQIESIYPKRRIKVFSCQIVVDPIFSIEVGDNIFLDVNTSHAGKWPILEIVHSYRAMNIGDSVDVMPFFTTLFGMRETSHYKGAIPSFNQQDNLRTLEKSIITKKVQKL